MGSLFALSVTGSLTRRARSPTIRRVPACMGWMEGHGTASTLPSVALTCGGDSLCPMVGGEDSRLGYSRLPLSVSNRTHDWG